MNQLEVDWTSVVELLCVKAVFCLQLFLELMLHLLKVAKEILFMNTAKVK